jgi:lipopolysaccharide export system permease protein
MNRLDRYILRTVLWYTTLAAAVLLTLAVLFVFISQQEDVGTGSYDLADALIVTLLLLPAQVFQMFPVAALLGALLGLGQLARGSELIVIRAAGVSVWRIARAAALAGLVLAGLMWLVGERVAPPLEKYAREMKAMAKSGGNALAAGDGAWVKEGNRIVSAAQQSADNMFGGLYIYTLRTDADGHQHLESFGHADTATLTAPRRWRLDNVVRSLLGSDGSVSAEHTPHLEVESDISPQFLGVAVVEPASLPVRGLIRYLDHLRANALDTRAYEVALWSRLARIASVIFVCVLAVPFVFGSLRSAGTGARLMLGVAIGIGFLLVSRVLGNSGEVYGLDPRVVGVAPTALLGLVAVAGIWRTR